MIKCIIIEDEPQAVLVLKSIVQENFNNIEIIGNFDKVSTAAAFIKKNKIDFAFLDVQLNGELGIDIANYLNKEELNFEIIFTTAHSDFAIEAFALSALDYILKPINAERLVEATNRVLKRRNSSIEQLKILQQVTESSSVEQIVLSTIEQKYFVRTADIIAITADNVYSEFHLVSSKKIVVSKPLKEYNLLLNNQEFYKPHRSYIINLNHMQGYKKGESSILMKNNFEVKLSRDNKKEFEELVSLHQK